MKSTILHLIPTLGGGGAERQLCFLAVEQARRGHRVYVGIRRAGVYLQEMQSGGVHIERLGDTRTINPRLFLAVLRLIRRVKPDIIQTWLPQMDLLGGLAAVCCRVPWIVTERSSADNYKPMPISAWLRLKLGRLASAVVANSDGGAGYWRGALRDRIVDFDTKAKDPRMLWKNKETGLQHHAVKWDGGTDTKDWPHALRGLVANVTEIKAPHDSTQGYLKLETTSGVFQVSPGMYVAAHDGDISLHHGEAFEVLNEAVTPSHSL